MDGSYHSFVDAFYYLLIASSSNSSKRYATLASGSFYYLLIASWRRGRGGFLLSLDCFSFVLNGLGRIPPSPEYFLLSLDCFPEDAEKFAVFYVKKILSTIS